MPCCSRSRFDIAQMLSTAAQRERLGRLGLFIFVADLSALELLLVVQIASPCSHVSLTYEHSQRRAIQLVPCRRQDGTGLELRAPHLHDLFVQAGGQDLRIGEGEGFGGAQEAQQPSDPGVIRLGERGEEATCRAFVSCRCK